MCCFFLECRVFEDASIFVVCIAVERFCRVNPRVPSQGKHPLLKLLFPRGGDYSDPFHCICKRQNWAGQDIVAQVCLICCAFFAKKLWRPACQDQLRLLFCFRSRGESDDSARGGATCVILETSVTTPPRTAPSTRLFLPACCTLLTVSSKSSYA